MKRNVWTSPFGLAFIIGTLAALIAGYFTGAGLRGSDTNMVAVNYSVAADNVASENLAETYPDENALIAANREPSAPVAAPQPSPPPAAAAPAPSPAPDTEAGPPDTDAPAYGDRPRRSRDRRDTDPSQDEPDDNAYTPQP